MGTCGCDPVQMVFNSHLQQRFDLIPGMAGDVLSEWVLFCTAIAKAAGPSSGFKGADASCGSNPQTGWWTPEVMGVV